MSNFDLTFCKVYIYAKGWPGINLGASHESCAHPTTKIPLLTAYKLFLGPHMKFVVLKYP